MQIGQLLSSSNSSVKTFGWFCFIQVLHLVKDGPYSQYSIGSPHTTLSKKIVRIFDKFFCWSKQTSTIDHLLSFNLWLLSLLFLLLNLLTFHWRHEQTKDKNDILQFGCLFLNPNAKTKNRRLRWDNKIVGWWGKHSSSDCHSYSTFRVCAHFEH